MVIDDKDIYYLHHKSQYGRIKLKNCTLPAWTAAWSGVALLVFFSFTFAPFWMRISATPRKISIRNHQFQENFYSFNESLIKIPLEVVLKRGVSPSLLFAFTSAPFSIKTVAILSRPTNFDQWRLCRHKDLNWTD